MYCPRCQHSATPSKPLKFPSKTWRTLHSPATWFSTQTKHYSFSISTMAAKLLSRRTDFHLCPCITGWCDGNSIKQQCSLSTITSYHADYIIYTNGFASGGTTNRVKAAVVTRGFPPQPDAVTTIKIKGQTFTSSYEEEAPAMESAVSWTLINANHHPITILFCTDSKSLCEALISSHLPTFSIHNSINSTSSSIFIQSIPGHSTIPGNDIVDKATKEATTIAADTILPIFLFSSIQIINETIRDATPIQERVASLHKLWRKRRKTDQQQKRWRPNCSLTIRSPSFSRAIPPLTRSFTRSQLRKLLPKRARSPSLDQQLSSFANGEATNVWVPSRVITVASHSTWKCSGVQKEDSGQPWLLTRTFLDIV